MNLMTLDAKITLDDASYRKGLNNAESMTQQFGKKVSAMTVAVGNIMADMMKKAASTVSGVVSDAIDGYADYQQLIGGVETLFKGSADRVARYAEQSYKTTGLSANQYMETVTSFSASLLQGLGNNTEAAAELANTAVVDMADNANKMGTDISSIQAAYMGFAKQNFTLLDNLKLGYGGTRSEMVRLINDSGILENKIDDLDGITFDQLIKAIHEIQKQMGITGTTAKEASETISGSKSSLAAAWKDLLSAVGGEGDQKRLDEAMENFKTSFSTYMENFIPTLATSISNSGSLVTAIAESISSLPTDLLSAVGKEGLKSGTEIVNSAGKLTHWLISSITDMFKSASIDQTDISNFGAALGDFLGSTISDLVNNAPAIIDGIVAAGVSLAGSFVKGLFEGLFGTGKEVDSVNDELSNTLGDIEFQTTKADAILDYMQSLIDKNGEAAKQTDEWKRAEGDLEKILGGSSDVFESYGGNVQGAVDKLRDMNKELKNAAIMNALQNASSEQIDLLTRQTLAYNEQEYIRNQNESIMQSARNNAVELIMSEAASKAKAYRESERFNPDDMGYKQLVAYSEGREIDQFGRYVQDITDIDFEGLKGITSFVSTNSEEAKRQIDANKKMYDEAESAATAAQAEMDTLQGEIDATSAAIETTKAAIEKTYTELAEGGDSAKSAVESSGDLLATALSAIASKISSVSIPGASSGGFLFNPLGTLLGAYGFMPRAVGIDYVPYSGFKTELHRGEAVITAEENARRRNGASADDFAEVMEAALVTAMNKVNVYMSGEKVGDLTTKRIQQNINGASYSRLRSMGG